MLHVPFRQFHTDEMGWSDNDIKNGGSMLFLLSMHNPYQTQENEDNLFQPMKRTRYRSGFHNNYIELNYLIKLKLKLKI